MFFSVRVCNNLASIKLLNGCCKWRCQSFQAPLVVSPSLPRCLCVCLRTPPGTVSAPYHFYSCNPHNCPGAMPWWLERWGVSPVGRKENLEGSSREVCPLQEARDSGRAFSLGGPCPEAYWGGFHGGYSPSPPSEPAGSFLGFLCEHFMLLGVGSGQYEAPPPFLVFRAQQILTLTPVSTHSSSRFLIWLFLLHRNKS